MKENWMPAFAGMTPSRLFNCHSRESGNPGLFLRKQESSYEKWHLLSAPNNKDKFSYQSVKLFSCTVYR